MKKLFIGISIITFSLTAFAFINNESGIESNDNEQAILFSINQQNGKIIFYGNDTLTNKQPQRNQEFMYFVGGKFETAKTITLEKLNNANLISDLIPNYPASWINEYISVELTSTIKGKEISTISKDNVLTPSQKELFKTIDINSEIAIKINYKTKNTVTNILDSREMNYSMLVTPATEADFVGGYHKMIEYLKNGSSEKIENIENGFDIQASISFIVTESGLIGDIELEMASKDPQIDQLMMDLIKNMPKWTPAKNAQNEAVPQELVFNYGNVGC